MDYINWLEKQNLLNIAGENTAPFKSVLKKCLGAEREDILIISDYGSEGRMIAPLMAASYYLAARQLNLHSRIILQMPKVKGENAEKQITDALLDLRKENIIIICMSQRMGRLCKELGNSYRAYATEQRHRWVSALKLGDIDTARFGRIVSAVDIDYEKLQQRALQIKSILDNGSEIYVTTKAGTDLRIGIEGTEARCNAGDYIKKGTGGNVPAGEVYIAPKWKCVEGTAVIDGSSSYRHGTQLVKEPITLTIKKGEVTCIEGGKEADNLRNTLDWAAKKARFPWGVRRTGEFGIGINPNAEIIGATIVDEKTLGTAHIALGSNYWFGGTIYSIIHLDQIFRNPRIEVDGKELKIERNI